MFEKMTTLFKWHTYMYSTFYSQTLAYFALSSHIAHHAQIFEAIPGSAEPVTIENINALLASAVQQRKKNTPQNPNQPQKSSLSQLITHKYINYIFSYTMRGANVGTNITEYSLYYMI